MTIEEIAKKLDDCASKTLCKSCQYNFRGYPTMHCEGYIIEEMGAECRKIVAEMGDDGK